MASEHPFFDELRQAIEGLHPMNEAFNPEFKTEARPSWTPHPNPQQRRLQDVFVGIPPTRGQIPVVADQTVDVNHQVVQELPSVPMVGSQVVYVLIAAYDKESGTPPDVVGVYNTKEKAKTMFDLLEKYRDAMITFYLVEKEVE